MRYLPSDAVSVIATKRRKVKSASSNDSSFGGRVVVPAANAAKSVPHRRIGAGAVVAAAKRAVENPANRDLIAGVVDHILTAVTGVVGQAESGTAGRTGKPASADLLVSVVRLLGARVELAVSQRHAEADAAARSAKLRAVARRGITGAGARFPVAGISPF